jgi:exo-beta-1,3-glucanase (GH17 family)
MANGQPLRIVDYGPYHLSDESPGTPVPTTQIEQDLATIATMGNAVRIYTTNDNLSYVVDNAANYGLQVVPSVFLDNPNSNRAPDPRPPFSTIIAQDRNIKAELDGFITLLNSLTPAELANIPFVVIGNEEISQVGGWYDGSIINAINYVKTQLNPGILLKFTTAESAGGQYYINNPQAPSDHHTTLGAAVDVIYANIFPYWEGVPITQAVNQVVTEYQELVNTYPGKEVVISETGWPSGGSPSPQNAAAVPSLANEQAFWQQFIVAAIQNGIPYGAFEAFDEPWKSTSIPGNTVDAFWGLYNSSGTPKTSITTLPANIFSVTDTSTGQSYSSAGEAYAGPVAGLLFQYIYTGSDKLNVTTDTANTFVHTSSGFDAIDVSHVGGTNVLDGGTNSNFLVGGLGANSSDTFFVDDRHPSSDIWSTVVNFHVGDAATIFGVTQHGFITSWVDGQGAAGYTGLTLHESAAGTPTASITLSGYTMADLSNGRLSTSWGMETDGTPYLYIHGNS